MSLGLQSVVFLSNVLILVKYPCSKSLVRNSPQGGSTRWIRINFTEAAPDRSWVTRMLSLMGESRWIDDLYAANGPDGFLLKPGVAMGMVILCDWTIFRDTWCGSLWAICLFMLRAFLQSCWMDLSWNSADSFVPALNQSILMASFSDFSLWFLQTWECKARQSYVEYYNLSWQ